MTDILKSSIEEVFQQHLGIKLSSCRSFPKQSGYTAKIDFQSGKKRATATVWVQKHTLKKVSEVLLFEENPDEETLKDLTSELANFIVGYAKMAASDCNMEFKIGTPRYAGVVPLQKGLPTFLYKIGNRCIAMQIKEKNG